MKHHLTFFFLVSLVATSPAQPPLDNLLRNGNFQDDWQTQLPELKNHHWNYSTEIYNRRDYNPDGWRLSGKWQWLDADKPHGQRRLVLTSPSKMVQTVNAVTINNPRKLEGWPDAGGFPAAEAVRSKNSLALVRNLTFLVRLKGTNVPRGAATITVAWTSASPMDDLLGTKPIASASVPCPEGTYAEKLVEVALPAAKWWLEAAKKDPMVATQGALLPMAIACEISFADKQAGQIELLDARLSETTSTAPNLLTNGGFEKVDEKSGAVIGWSKPQKYRYFPPGVYYIFNTWHNSNSKNRGVTGQDSLVPFTGNRSLQMVVPSGDELCVISDPITLNQTEARLIEVRAWVKTEQLAMMQIDAEDEKGQRIDGFNFIHKQILSIGTNDWRQVRQVFRPAAPLKQIRLKLCARGTNGYTLDDTGPIPQQNVTGMIWWDAVTLTEPESTAAQLSARGLAFPPADAATASAHLKDLNLGERMLGTNTLTAQLHNPGIDAAFRLELALTSPNGVAFTFKVGPFTVARGKSAAVLLPYSLTEPCPAYHEYGGELRLIDAQNKVIARSQQWLATWPVPLDLDLGALYLRPEQKLFVRVNPGLAHPETARLKEYRLDVVRRGTGQVLKTFSVAATPDDVLKRRSRIPDGVREDLRGLILTDLDVSFLPLQPFNDPQRNWLLRVTALDAQGKALAEVQSPPFCRLAHDGPQPAITSVKINKDGDFLVNDKPWMPWGVTYGHNPVYEGPAEAMKFLDPANLPQWGIYDRHGGNLAERAIWDVNCLRHVEGALVKRDQLEGMWKKNLYASTVFLPALAPAKPWPADHLTYLRTAPNVAAVSRGPEEAFGYFTPMTAPQLESLKTEVNQLRQATGKPVMVSHGGYWNRLEFEKAPFFDVYDPETEPWYPAPLHTDLRPLVDGQAKTVWLRPQMYEDVPFERWRYHVFVELMRGARGWQVAHGPGDTSTMRGLHAELKHLQPLIYAKDKTPAVKIEPPLEHMVRKSGKKSLIVAATTHGMSFGNWAWSKEETKTGRARVTVDPFAFSDESDGYHALTDLPAQALSPHGIQYLIDPQKWPAGTKLVTQMKLDKGAAPKNLVALVKADGRWTHAAAWGKADFAALRKNNDQAFWFLRTFYRHARGFLGWGSQVPPYALAYIPELTAAMGELPAAGEWQTLEVPLEKIAAAGKLLDGVAFLHEGGRVWWANTVLRTPDGKETVVFGDHEDRPDPKHLEKVKISVPGLKKGAEVRVVFEDRVILADDGYFTDDFRGTDLYQRYGGERSGYGNSPVALHIYEIIDP